MDSLLPGLIGIGVLIWLFWDMYGAVFALFGIVPIAPG